MTDLQQLQQRFSAHKELSFRQQGDGLMLVDITNPLATATISLQGAQLTDWAPVGQQPVIWVSDNSFYQSGRSIRGGVPICWPWFGDHVTDASLPAHGFVRTKIWNLESVAPLVDGSTRLSFSYTLDKDDQIIWPCQCTLHMNITIGKELELALQTSNTGQQPLTITEALHTYFRVGDVNQVRVAGLEDTHYLDKVEGYKQKTQSGMIDIQGEVDRVYLDTADPCRIEDPLMNRNIIIKKEGSHSTVIWNPWLERSIAMADMGEQAYQTMLCVESANAASNRVVIEAGDTHCMTVCYQVEGR